MVTTEQKPHTEAPQAERTVSPEKRLQQELQRKLAEITILAILIATYQNKESDRLFKPPEPRQPETPDPAANRAEIFGLINHAFARGKPTRESQADSYAGGHFEYKPRNVFVNNISGYRDSIFSPQRDGSPQPTEPKPAPEFRPAPSMSDTELGPKLPDLAFGDRVRPVGRQPGEADFAAADRANQMYQGELFKKGWRGGEATPEQAKRAGKALNFAYSPDRNPHAAGADAEAVKAFNANRAKPTTSDEGTFGTQKFD